MEHRLGIIGIGKMGEPIAENLHSAGFSVVTYARRAEVCKRMRDKGIAVARTPKELAEGSDVIFDILTDTSATWAVIEQRDGLLEGIKEPKIIIDMTTSDPIESIKLGKFLNERKIEYLDAPITGGVIAAKAKTLVLMVGGNERTFQNCRYILEKIAKKMFYMGEMGNGHYMKLVHNQLSHSTFLAACEAVTLGVKLGLHIETVIEVFNEGNARSYATEVRFPRFILSGSYDAGASFKTVHKDIGLVMEITDKLRLDFPIARATFNYWDYPIKHGQGEKDYTTIFTLIKEICKTSTE